MMATSTEALIALITSARGERPQSMASTEAEEVLTVALALLVELSVSNDRIDRLERMVADLRGEPVAALRDVRYDGDAARERREATEALLVRAMRIFLDPRVQATTPSVVI
ncbi:MAG: hypothetical protein J0J06_02505 [Sphingomonas sp.]|uniref:hypothetical protein n=1 Tax=Sphingomonas sp. TaxID=28214 RepID=UPI001AD57DB9|nr:hypothetical protein [Sphingomonas sp.]MBN8814300.1 hypothetical protein [Sphingomonas sp.]